MTAPTRESILSILAHGPATVAYIECALRGPPPAVHSTAWDRDAHAATRDLLRLLPALVADGSIQRIEDGEIVTFAVPL